MEPQFIHLRVHSAYSLLEGAMKIPALMSRAAAMGFPAMAVTDTANMFGAKAFSDYAPKNGIKPILGTQMYIRNSDADDVLKSKGRTVEPDKIVLLVKNAEGYANVTKLMKIAYLGEKNFAEKPQIRLSDLKTHGAGLIALTAGVDGTVGRLLLENRAAEAEDFLLKLKEIFGDRLYMEISRIGLEKEAKTENDFIDLAYKHDIPLVATNEAFFFDADMYEAHDALVCIARGEYVANDNREKYSPNQRLKTAAEMVALFADLPEAVANTINIAKRCNYVLQYVDPLLPIFECPEGKTQNEYLREEAYKGLAHKMETQVYFEGMTEEEKKELDERYYARLEYELSVIEKMGFAGYFLIVSDFIRWSKTHGVPVGPGRGSGAGSMVAWSIQVTELDPLKLDLLFERFLNPERVSMPDIDTDFCYEKRQQVLDYIINRYGQEKVAQIITFGTLQARAAVRDVGRALEMPYSMVDNVAKLIPRDLGITLERALEASNELRSLYENDANIKRLIDLAQSVEGMPRNSGTHAAGVVIAPDDLKKYVPLQLSNENFITTEYDKDKIESLGLLKMDLLGLRTLTVIGDAIKFIYETTGDKLDIDKIPLDDEATCSMLRKGDTQGVFQLESGGMTKLVMDLGPESFEDLIPLVALYRPGPLGTGMVEDFIAGRHGEKTAEMLHPLLEPVLKDTFGVILYQEQVMQITSVLAGFSLGQADILRRAMGKKKAKELDSMREAFIDGAQQKHGISPQLSSEIFALLQHFAGYGFNKSHSAAYALVAYQTAYLKAHWPAEFMAAFLTSVISDSEKLSWYISVCRSMGLKILPPDVNESGRSFSVNKDRVIRFGLAGVKNVGENAIGSILQARKEGPFKSLMDFCKRVDNRAVNKRMLENLIKCGAMDSFGYKRSELLAVAEQAMDMGSNYQKDYQSGQMGLFGDDSFADVNELRIPELEEIPKRTILQYEKELIGFYVTGNPLDAYVGSLYYYTPLRKISDASEVLDGKYFSVAGIISDCRIRNTRQGDSMAILTLEDFNGKMEIVVFPKVYRDAARLLYQENAISVEGKLSIDERERKIQALKIKPLQEVPPDLHIKIMKKDENGIVQKGLKQIFESFSGDTPDRFRKDDQSGALLLGGWEECRCLPGFR